MVGSNHVNLPRFRGRIWRLWESLNTKRNGELISLDMVLIDENNLVNKFNHLLKERNVSVLKNFKVVESSGTFKVIDSNLKIVFTLLTKVEKVDAHVVPSIPMHGFQLASEKTLNDRLNDDNILTCMSKRNIIGCLTVVGDVEIVRGGFRKRDLEIIPELHPKLCNFKCKQSVLISTPTMCWPSLTDLLMFVLDYTWGCLLSVRDDTDVVNCVVLHKLAERMVDSSPLKLLNKYDPDKDNLPSEITSLSGQKFVLCLQLSNYNIKHDNDIFTVYKETVLSDMKNLDAIGGIQPYNNATPTTTRKKKFIVNDDDAND
ncbi:Nucleic acid-binding, OB-fold [Cynara cardunculus var. scolymus]|uniref:Nucleic acid-binding, OB-fold n=1 Tax=Cynara cardunculus var. scolymus TaxID=59895 RepID=A0A124SFX8_CYNCS|nr:Nucleic acid-binding, OB-fold [Cynara cardunculus var. scolymus]